MRSLSVAMAGSVHCTLSEHLLRPDRQEDVCFAVYYTSTGANRDTCLITEVVLPQHGERNVHGNASFSGRYFLRALEVAEDAGAGLALAHSHPGGRDWQDMSDDDIVAEQRYAAQTLSITGLPLVGLTLAADKRWSARSWTRASPAYARLDARNVRVLGEGLEVTYHPTIARIAPADSRMTRTISAWGNVAQSDLSRQHVGVVGAGSVGAIVAEALARTGVQRITLLDFDGVELHNLDRLSHAKRRDVYLRRAKVDVLRDALLQYGTAPDLEVVALASSIVEPTGYAAALDCDVLFSCVDRPWPRQVLDHIAFAHLIPVIDGGVAVRANPTLTNADWKAHVAMPGRPCLECLGQYLAADVALERAGDLDDPTYIDRLPDDHRLKTRQNVYAFCLNCASLEILQWLSMSVAPAGIADVGSWNFHFVTGALDQNSTDCHEYCSQRQTVARGDQALGGAPTAKHPVAEAARAVRRQHQHRPDVAVITRLTALKSQAETTIFQVSSRLRRR